VSGGESGGREKASSWREPLQEASSCQEARSCQELQARG